MTRDGRPSIKGGHVIEQSQQDHRKDGAIVVSQAAVDTLLPVIPYNWVEEDRQLMASGLAMDDQTGVCTRGEKHVWRSIAQFSSQTSMATNLKVCRTQIVAKLRALAVLTVLYKRVRGCQSFIALNTMLSQRFLDVEPLEWVTKVKYDEMALVLVVPQGEGVNQSDKLLVNLLQICVTWAAVWLIDGKTAVNLIVRAPTLLQSVDNKQHKMHQPQADPCIEASRLSCNLSKADIDAHRSMSCSMASRRSFPVMLA